MASSEGTDRVVVIAAMVRPFPDYLAPASLTRGSTRT
jgi:hypothetical protein